MFFFLEESKEYGNNGKAGCLEECEDDDDDEEDGDCNKIYDMGGFCDDDDDNNNNNVSSRKGQGQRFAMSRDFWYRKLNTLKAQKLDEVAVSSSSRIRLKRDVILYVMIT